MKIRSGRDTLLVAGVPQKRGSPVHYQHVDEMPSTEFEGNVVTEIHTPTGKPFVRIHELMHARHTNHRRYKRVYKSVPGSAAQLLEDIRLHAKHWPWSPSQTPPSVRDATFEAMRVEANQIAEHTERDPTARGSFPDFACRLRAASVLGALNGRAPGIIEEIGFAPGQQKLALQVYENLRRGKEDQAAKLVAAAFFADHKPPPQYGGGAGSGFTDPTGDDLIAVDGFKQPNMQIIELAHTEHVEGASIGSRRATMGSRMYRPALRRPLLPQRLFVRRTPQEPGGTILIDASGSMGDMENIGKWLEHAPFGTIAYYAGNGRNGWLWVYARNGRRAKDIPEPDSRGNTVDGPAITWLMNQPRPRIMVTDRGFCDCTDSMAQVARLARLEAEGEIVVKNYNNEGDN